MEAKRNTEILGMGITCERLDASRAGAFCRYYMGLRGYEKSCAYFSAGTLELLREFAPNTSIGARSISTLRSTI
ncbi:MAG: hypothetical protein J7L12_03670 [Desulfurococcales archaeon]|nr:hypothetical protein [Desulfurococcales archaeon]